MEMSVTPLGQNPVKIALLGRLDTPGVDHVETQFVASVVPLGHNAIVDLSRVDYVASMGIRMLLGAAHDLRLRSAMIAIFGAQDRVKDILETVGIGHAIPICSTETEALAAVA